ncbi:MAG: Asp-tRNA(Asn)/Glu-tRNA(Gln) amidotransferase subunit GatB [Oscillospiraceae bacterium]|nr:Asp-tRNA(Asn)/Glu-tRNA(Gln) amidotransferase subunit GatB [Oscillospiraceae bacterium]
MQYEVVMGLEVHVELATDSKLFCGCSAKFGAEANENVCPACAGMPGLLPVVNKRAVEFGIKAALATNSEITETITFDKKNYFYPDLPTGHQITQLYAPICRNGWVGIETKDGTKKIRLKQIHIEEDAGKLVHMPGSSSSMVDFNRASVPLIEIVSEPDFRSAEEVAAYLRRLRALLIYAEVSDCKMHEGSMRVDINISVREVGDEKYGTRVEVKNLNSFRSIKNAIEYEKNRQIDALETGFEEIVQETRRWDDEKNRSYSMRTKEDATDYRYFPNPDVAPIVISDEWVKNVKSSLPEMPGEKYNRFITQYGLGDYDTNLLTESKRLSEIFEETVSYCGNPKEVANWLIVELLSRLKREEKEIEDITFDWEKFSKIIKAVLDNTVNRNTAKKIFYELYDGKDIDLDEYIKSSGMITDRDLLTRLCEEAVEGNPKGVEKYKGGKVQVFDSFFGSVMGKTRGKADTAAVREILKGLLDR